MVITKQALKQFLTLPEHVKQLTMQKITEVESFQVFEDSPFLVIGHVLSRKNHPNSDHLNLTQVDVGNEVLDIVCGASNVDKGQYVIVAKVGAILPGNFEIKSATIRGQKSEGMICSLKELGFSDKVITDAFKSGIYYFDTPQTPGSSAYEALHLNGFSMELSLTPNRGDLLSVLGFAYDLGAMINQKVGIPNYPIQYSQKKNPFQVSIKTPNTSSYHVRVFNDITIKPSPWYIQQLLIQNDIRPINNIVDITNYVMLLIGSPLHAFDFNTFGSKEVVVRQATEGETVVTLDGITRTLESGDIVITNGTRPVALAGVMGLESTMITEHTKDVVLEAAVFNSSSISSTSKRLGLRSDASLRFERGVSDETARLGLELATYLFQTLSDATVLEGTASESTNKPSKSIVLPFEFVKSYLGIDLTKDEIVSYLLRYQYDVEVSDTFVKATVPHFRTDIHEPHDLIEEIARMYGLDVIPIQPLSTHLTGGYTHKQRIMRELKHSIIHKGFQEIITYSLRPEKEVLQFPLLGNPISLLMPLSEDRKFLRQSLVPGMLESLSYNVKRQQTQLHFVEMGKVFYQDHEVEHLTMLMHGPFMGYRVSGPSLKPNIYMVKSMIRHIETMFQVKLTVKYDDIHAIYHPYQSANLYLNDKKVGHFGTLHPSLLAAYDVSDVYSLTVYLDDLYGYQVLKHYEPISKFPSVTRDLSLVMDRSMSLDQPLNIIRQTLKAYLEDVIVFDVYKGEHMDPTKQSVAFRMVLNDSKQTLESDEVDKLIKKVTNRLSFELHMEIRS